MNRLEQQYKEKIIPTLMQEHNLTSAMQVPRIEKIVLNSGVSDAVTNSNSVEETRAQLARICGQKPIITHARKSLAAFKLRTGMAVGVKVTLRRKKMYEFLDKLINIALPRVRDFRGLSLNSFDSQGNYSLGVAEMVIFPEAEYETIKKARGLDITIVTNSTNKVLVLDLFKKMGFPFKHQQGNN